MICKRRLLFLSLIAACLIPLQVLADDSPQQSAKAQASVEDPFSMDLESLLNMKVITASKFSENISDAPGVMSVVTKDELQRFGGITLREILERVPGLAGSTASFTDRSIVAVRGDQTKINGGHILFLINGRPTREILEGGLVSDLLESLPQ
jgi:iron complex outermembrane receptor protein